MTVDTVGNDSLSVVEQAIIQAICQTHVERQVFVGLLLWKAVKDCCDAGVASTRS